MASDQARAERDRVPKLTTHFESLSEKSRDGREHKTGEGDHPKFESLSENVQDTGGGEKDQQSKGEGVSKFAKEKGNQAKEVVLQGTQSASHYVAEKSRPLKDATVETGKTAAAKASNVAAQAKDTTAETGRNAAAKAAGVAVQTKDAAIEAGKNVVTKAGEAAAEATERAVAAGWGAAHYASEKTVGAAKAAAEYTGKKKEDAGKELESKVETGEEENRGGGQGGMEAMEFVKPEDAGRRTEGEGAILEAIGETVVEIAQAAKDFVAVGKDKKEPPPKKEAE